MFKTDKRRTDLSKTPRGIPMKSKARVRANCQNRLLSQQLLPVYGSVSPKTNNSLLKHNIASILRTYCIKTDWVDSVDSVWGNQKIPRIRKESEGAAMSSMCNTFIRINSNPLHSLINKHLPVKNQYSIPSNFEQWLFYFQVFQPFSSL